MTLDLIIKIIPIILSIIALVFSIIGWKYSRISIRQTIKNSYMSALFDIDKQLINTPSLWTIYDEFPEGLIKDNDPKEKGQRRAFIDYHFNLFEVTHTNYTRILFKNRADREFWESMKKYIIQFFKSSTEARNIFKEENTQQSYLTEFVILVNDIIDKIERKNLS